MMRNSKIANSHKPNVVILVTNMIWMALNILHLMLIELHFCILFFELLLIF